MKVENLKNDSGKPVLNQFVINVPGKQIFQSYDSRIVILDYRENGTKVYLDKNYWDYSKTTGKYRNMFLGETKKETMKKIKSGEYKLLDLQSWPINI